MSGRGLALGAAAWCLFASPAGAQGSRPFWADRDSYVEGEYLYAAGRALAAPSKREGRRMAFEAAKAQLGDFVQLSDLGKLKVEPVREHLEPAGGDSVDLFLLVRTLYAPLVRLKKDRDLEAVDRVARLRRDQEEMLKGMKLQLDRLSATHGEAAVVQAQLGELVKSIDRTTNRAAETVRMGMTEPEVVHVAGPAVLREKCGTDVSLNYRKLWVLLKNGVAACWVPTEQYNSSCMACNSWGAVPLK